MSGYHLGKPTLQMREVATLEGRIRILEDFVRKGIRNPLVRAVALEVVSQCPARNDWCEIGQIFYFIKRNVRYTQDIFGIDTYQHPARTLQWRGGDCFSEGTLLLTEDFRFVPVEFAYNGMRIWGKDAWTTVEEVWAKGTLPVTAVRFNNGSWVRLTDDHKVYVLRCPEHERANLQATANKFTACGQAIRPCFCGVAGRVELRVHVKDLRLGDVVVTPSRLAFGRAAQDPDLAPRMASMGRYAPEQRALSIDLDEGAAGALLRGIMADSGANNGGRRTFTSTSRELALQVRILHKMFGIDCGASYIEGHGGLGSHPVWRLVPRIPKSKRKDGKALKLLRVDAIEPDVARVPCYDLTTSDHYVYLPEADVTVSNCDDHSAAICALLSAVGFQTGFRVISVDGKVWEHIYALVGMPKGVQHPTWYVLDTTVPSSFPNWQPKRIAAARDFKPIKLI